MSISQTIQSLDDKTELKAASLVSEKELGFFANQNSVCRPRAQKWDYSVDRLKKIWNITD